MTLNICSLCEWKFGLAPRFLWGQWPGLFCFLRSHHSTFQGPAIVVKPSFPHGFRFVCYHGIYPLRKRSKAEAFIYFFSLVFILESTGFLELKTTFFLKCPSKSLFWVFFSLCYLMGLYKVFKHCPVWPVIRMISACPTEVQAVSSQQENVLRWPLPVWVSMLLHKAFPDSAKILQQIFLLLSQIVCCRAGTFWILGGQKVALGRKRSKVSAGTKICSIDGEAVPANV